MRRTGRRPTFRYVREDFFLAGEFDDIEDLNAQFERWRRDVANARHHGTTGRVVAEVFAEERDALQPLPAVAYGAVLRIQRRISRDGMVSVDGNLYSVPDRARRRVVDVQVSAERIELHEDGQLLAVHAPFDGSGRRIVLPEHRVLPPPRSTQQRPASDTAPTLLLPGERVHQRALAVYESVGRALAEREVRAS